MLEPSEKMHKTLFVKYETFPVIYDCKEKDIAPKMTEMNAERIMPQMKKIFVSNYLI